MTSRRHRHPAKDLAKVEMEKEVLKAASKAELRDKS